jgi:3-phosphoshikimate 1-carboxyvinyltransferase
VLSESENRESSPRRAIIRRAEAPLRGRISISGDKSISIRRALLTLFTTATVELENFGSGEDCLTALYCLRQLCKQVDRVGRRVRISGCVDTESAALDCRNSGTCARLLMGILAGRPGNWTLTGDASLTRRPMERVAHPLRTMGAEIKLTDGCLPASIVGRKLHSSKYDSPIASAQVKSAVLLAGLSGGATVEYREPHRSREHTERLLGIQHGEDGWIRFDPKSFSLSAERLSGEIPADTSSAAFWGIAATLITESEVRIDNLLATPLRCGWIEVMQRAGSRVEVRNQRLAHGEEIADFTFRDSRLQAFSIEQEFIPSVIDEIPILSVAASLASGPSRFAGLGELRVKESNRLLAISRSLTDMGVSLQSDEKTLHIKGPTLLKSAIIESKNDHRIAMAFAIAGLCADKKTVIEDADCVKISYPEFWETFTSLTHQTVIREYQ